MAVPHQLATFGILPTNDVIAQPEKSCIKLFDVVRRNYFTMKHSFKYLAIGILFAVSQTLLGQEEIPKSTIVDTLPFTLTSHNNLSIQAVFGGVDTLDLMFHTAANAISLTTKATKNMKSIEWDEQHESKSWGGTATARLSRNNAVDIGAFHWDSLSVWEDENSGPTTDGKFGPYLFEGYVIEVDYEKRVLILHESLPQKTAVYEKMPVRFEHGDFFIEGTSLVGGVEYKNHFLVHSGYGGTVLYDDQFAAESNIGERIEIISEKELKDSYGNVIKVQKGLLPTFTLGSVALTDVPVGFFQGKIGRQQMSVLGADVLKRFNMIIDYGNGQMYLKPNQLKDLAYTQF